MKSTGLIGLQISLVWAAALALTACGGGGGSSAAAPAPPAPKYTVEATVSGLAGSGLVLQDNGGDNLSVSANGSVTFVMALGTGSAYSVTVATQPTGPSQTCTVANGSGTVGAANITNVAVTCTTNTYSIGGSVSGLSGSGLVLQDNLGDNLTVSANGPFTFATAIASGAAYSVTVATQPAGPSQTCVVTTGSGMVGAAAVTTVAVACTTNSYSIGGMVSGLVGTGLVLQDNGGDSLPVSASGAFTFATAIASGAAYNVTVLSLPASQTCTVTNGAGTVGGSNVTSIAVTCSVNAYTLGGTLSGLTGSGLVLKNNAGESLPVSANGPFTFVTALASGTAYSVTVLTQPTTPSQYCVITNATGTVAMANVSSVSVLCRTTGRVAYAANHSGSVSVFTINPTTGALTTVAGSPFTAGAGPSSIAVTPNAMFAYVANADDGTVSAYTIDPVTSALTAVSGSPYAVGNNPQSVAIDPSGKFVYVANFTDGDVSAFTINQTTGVLTAVAGSPFAADVNPQNVTVDPTGRFAYVLDYANRDMSIYAIDATTGILTQITGSPFFGLSGSGPFYMAITPSDQFGYIANNDGSNHIIGVSLDPGTGAPTALAGSPFFGVNIPWALAIDPSGQFLYAVNKAADNLTGYTIDSVTGNLTVMTASPFATDLNPRSIAIDPSGQFVYVANGDANDVSIYTIAPSTGALTAIAGGPYLTGNGPVSIVISK